MAMDIRNFSLTDVIQMSELIGGQEEFIAEMKRIAGILHIMGKSEDPLYTIDDVYKLTIGELQDQYVKTPAAPATPKTKTKAAKVAR